MTNKARRVSNEDMARALRYTRGMVATAAHNLGISRQAIYNRLARSPGLAELIENERERITDFAETKLLDAMRAGDVPALRFYLSTQGRKRGYVMRTETDLTSDGQRIEFTLNIGQPPSERDEDTPE